jgi:hypothetical protein
MCFGPTMSLVFGVSTGAAAVYAARTRRPWRAVFWSMLALVEFVEVWQYGAHARGGGTCAESVATMWVMVALIATQPLLFLAIAEEERPARDTWWFRWPTLRRAAWGLYLANLVFALPSLVAGPGHCTWWFCDTFTGTSIGGGGHIAWHLHASALGHPWIIVYLSSIAAMAAAGAHASAVTFLTTMVVTHLALGWHTGPAAWCALAGSAGLLEGAQWLQARIAGRGSLGVNPSTKR